MKLLPRGHTPPGRRVGALLLVGATVFFLGGFLPAQEEAPSWDFHGRLDASWRYRNQDRRNQADNEGLFSANLDGVAKDSDGAETFRFHFDGFATADYNGLERPGDSFYGLADTRNNNFRSFVYGAWAETPALADGMKLRVGRQEVHREDALYFDGVRADFSNGSPWSGVVYAGAPVRFYESNRSGDFLGGVGLRWRARRGLSFGADEIYLKDRNPVADRSLKEVKNNLTILSGRWYRDEHTLVRGSSSWIDGHSRRAELSVLWNFPETGWWSRIQLRRQNDYGEVVATDLSPFAATLGDVAPYWSGSAEIRRRIATGTDLGIGYQGRWLESSQDAGLYNREYDRWFATLSQDDLFLTHLRAGIRGDIWNADHAHSVAGGAFAAYEPAKGQRFEVGTDFLKYRFDIFTGREYLDDRQVYARLRIPVMEDTSFRFRVARDRSQFGTDYLLEAALALEF